MSEKRPSTHHDNDAFHHVLTIEIPQQSALFPEKPLQKHQFALQKKTCKTRTQNPGKNSEDLIHGLDGDAFGELQFELIVF